MHPIAGICTLPAMPASLIQAMRRANRNQPKERTEPTTQHDGASLDGMHLIGTVPKEDGCVQMRFGMANEPSNEPSDTL